MNLLRSKAQQILRAMDFANIDRLDELQSLLEERAAARIPEPREAVEDELCRREFGDDRIVDFLFARRTALRSSGRAG